VRTFYYKAYDDTGGKRSGIIEAACREDVDAELRRNGLTPYFLHDYHKLKEMLRHKEQKRRKLIALFGTAATIMAMAFSVSIVRYASRERAPRIEDYRRTGIVSGSPGLIVAKTKEQRQFAIDMLNVWQSFCPAIVRGIEVSNVLMTIYLTSNVSQLSRQELEILSSNTVRALQRQFRASGCTLLVIEDDKTILEISYNSVTKSTHVRSFR